MSRKMSDEARQRKAGYDRRYHDEHIRKRVIDFNMNTPEDVEALEHLDSQPNKAGYMKGLILNDKGTGK